MNLHFTFNINIDDRIIAFGKRVFTKRTAIALIAVTVVTASALLYAAVTKPHTFTPGAVISSSQVNANFDAAFRELSRIAPVGAIVAWHKSMFNTPTLPDGWAECNGQVLLDDESVYNGQTVPNLNGKSQSYHSKGIFLRGDSTSGVLEDDSYQGHWHSLYYVDSITVNLGSSASFNRYESVGSNIENNVARGSITDGINGTPRTATETRPVNMSVVWIMRVK